MTEHPTRPATMSAAAAAELDAVAGQPFFSSWSGGKDSYLALQRAVNAGGRPIALLTMMREDGRFTHSHALPARPRATPGGRDGSAACVPQRLVGRL